MAKKWSELQVGDKLVAVKDDFAVTAGKTYTIIEYIHGKVAFYDDTDKPHWADEDWVLVPAPDDPARNPLRISVDKAPEVLNEVYPGQVRMDTDGFVVLVIHPIYNESDRYNVVLLNDPHNELEPVDSVEFRLNKTIGDFTAEEICHEFPFIVDAELKVTAINEGGR